MYSFRIYQRFKDDYIAHGVFLECLEPYIVKDQLDNVSPEVLKDFVEHYQAKSKSAPSALLIIQLT